MVQLEKTQRKNFKSGWTERFNKVPIKRKKGKQRQAAM
jgi:hypothetical protein